MDMETVKLMNNLTWVMGFISLGCAGLMLIFKKQKQLITLISTLVPLMALQYIIYSQRDYIFDEYPKIAYSSLVLLLLMYFDFYRELIALIKIKKLNRDIPDQESS